MATRDYDAKLTRRSAAKAERADLAWFLQPSCLIPTDGVVKAKSQEIVRGARTDAEKASAIYDWIVENTFRDPARRWASSCTPQAETARGRLDCLDPDNFKYQITARQI